MNWKELGRKQSWRDRGILSNCLDFHDFLCYHRVTCSAYLAHVCLLTTSLCYHRITCPACLAHVFLLHDFSFESPNNLFKACVSFHPSFSGDICQNSADATPTCLLTFAFGKGVISAGRTWYRLC
jgi:hypothetical protein